MKSNTYRSAFLSGILSLLLMFSVVSCKDDDSSGPWDTQSIDVLLTEAENLIANSVEGISPGDYKPGSKAELQEVVTWVNWKLLNSDNQDEIADAANKLSIYIDKFKANTVSLAIPWIKQEPDAYIELLDNPSGGGETGKLKGIVSGSFTIETKVYVVNLQQRGHSNNLFSSEQMGPDSGFGVRYFGDGHIEIVVGDNGWTDVKSDPGVITAGKWIHVALTNDGSHQALYIDGVEVISQDASYLMAADVPIVIGNSPTWKDRVVNALVKDFRLWGSIRTQQQVNDNKDAELTGTETDLEVLLPLNSDLGSEFTDVSGKYKAKFVGEIAWMLDGIPPVIELDPAALNTAIASAETLKASVTEGTNDGDYPVGTVDYIQALIDDATEVKEDAIRQDQLDSKADYINTQLAAVQKNLVADATGVLIDREDPDAVGLRITPNYTPQGDYTIEFDVKVKSLFGYGTGEFFNNGENGVWVYGYTELTEENVLQSGGLRNFSHDDSDRGWDELITDPLVMKTGEWQHVAVVHDNTARTTKIYVDGVEKAVSEDRGSLRESGWGEMWLGNGWGKMDGSIKDFRLWDVVRAADDLNADIDGSEAGLSVYFPLDKVAGVKFNDVTGNYQAEMRGIVWNK